MFSKVSSLYITVNKLIFNLIVFSLIFIFNMQQLDSYMCLLAKKIEKGLIIGKDVHSYCITDSNIYVSITCDNLFGLFALDIYFF